MKILLFLIAMRDTFYTEARKPRFWWAMLLVSVVAFIVRVYNGDWFMAAFSAFNFVMDLFFIRLYQLRQELQAQWDALDKKRTGGRNARNGDGHD